MKNFVLPALLLIVLVGCKQKEKMLAKKWQAVSIYSPQMDSMIATQEKIIDTFGKNTDAATNIQLYGTANVDSFRASMKAELQDYKAMQEHSLKTTWFDFRKDKVAFMNFSGMLDSCKWSVENENELILDEMTLKGSGDRLTMIIEELTDKSLKLKFNDGGYGSTITFTPVKN